MVVGYLSELNLGGSGVDFSGSLEKIVKDTLDNNLDVLVIAGGISSDYKTTLRFVNELGKRFSDIGKLFRFVVGNRDFYYDESVVDKRSKFDDILRKYRLNPYYLPSHLIITKDVRIVGAESWYDYTLYRGKSIPLRKVTKKSKFFIKNSDVDYITDQDDYLYGVKDTFDVSYTKECSQSLSSTLDRLQRKCGITNNSVVVQYFYPDKVFLNRGYLENYFGTFKGSAYTSSLLRSHNVTECYFGLDSDKKSAILGSLKIKCVSNFQVVTY